MTFLTWVHINEFGVGSLGGWGVVEEVRKDHKNTSYWRNKKSTEWLETFPLFLSWQIALFVSSSGTLQPGWLINFLRSISSSQIQALQMNLAKVCSSHLNIRSNLQVFQYAWLIHCQKDPLLNLNFFFFFCSSALLNWWIFYLFVKHLVIQHHIFPSVRKYFTLTIHIPVFLLVSSWNFGCKICLTLVYI